MGIEQQATVRSPLSRLNFQWQSLFFRMLRNWYWFVISLTVILFLTWLFLRSASPTYLVRGTFLLREEQYNSSFSQEVGVVVEMQGAKMQQFFLDQTQIMKSLSLMMQVVDSLDIDIEYFVSGRLKKSEIYGSEVPFKVVQATPRALFNDKVLTIKPLDSIKFQLVRGENDTLTCLYGVPFEYKRTIFQIDRIGQTRKFGSYEIRFNDPLKVARNYSNRVSFNPVQKSFVIAATLVDHVPEKGVDIINTLLYFYNRSVVDDKNKVGQNTLDFIGERLGEMEKELFAVEQQVESYKQKEDIPLELASSTQLLLNDLTALEREIIQYQTRIELLEQFEKMLRTEVQEFEYLPISSEIANSAIAQLFEEYNSLVLERDRILQTAGSRNPVLKDVEQRIGDLRSNIFSGIEILKRELRNLMAREEARLKPYESKITSVPRNERELFDIERQRQIKDELYRFLLQKREETRLNVATQVPDTKMVDTPMLQNLVFPKKIQLFLLAFFLAMGIPAGILFVRESTDNNIYSEDDIAEMTKTPFLGAIAQSKSKKPIVIRKSSRSAIAEMFRLLRTNLQFVVGEAKTPVVMITSATSGEGKTFTGINLGLSIALSRKRTVLIGADLRKPKLTFYLTGEKSKEGLSNYLVGQKTLEELVLPSGVDENLFYIGSGPLPPNPAELLMQDKMKILLDYLRQHYDFVIVDISPVGLVTDALLLKDVVDATIFVTRFKVTKKATLRLINDIYTEKKLPNPSIVLNGVKRNTAYGYGGNYGYGYGYGYYEEEKTNKLWKLFQRQQTND